MNKAIFKRVISLLLAVVMSLTAFFGVGALPAYAAEETNAVYPISFPRDGDTNYGDNWGHEKSTYMNGWSLGASDYITIRGIQRQGTDH